MFDWVKRRWFDLRNGYSYYFAIALSFVNFILIISIKFPNVSVAVLALLIGSSVAAAATAVGYGHRKKQLDTDQNSGFEHSTLAAKVEIILLKMVDGSATPEERAWAYDLLQRIVDGKI